MRGRKFSHCGSDEKTAIKDQQLVTIKPTFVNAKQRDEKT